MNPVSPLASIMTCLLAASATRTTVLAGVDGRGGAGKTHFAARVQEELQSAGLGVDVVHFDDFFLPRAERWQGAGAGKPVGGDFDWMRLRREVLDPLHGDRVARYERYDWASDALTDTCEVLPGGIVIVEGVYCTRRELRDLYDLRLWVTCPPRLRLARGMERDGRSARGLWELDWMPNEDLYVERHHPERSAHFVIDGSGGRNPHP
jgi:uridine kinase